MVGGVLLSESYFEIELDWMYFDLVLEFVEMESRKRRLFQSMEKSVGPVEVGR